MCIQPYVHQFTSGETSYFVLWFLNSCSMKWKMGERSQQKSPGSRVLFALVLASSPSWLRLCCPILCGLWRDAAAWTDRTNTTLNIGLTLEKVMAGGNQHDSIFGSLGGTRITTLETLQFHCEVILVRICLACNADGVNLCLTIAWCCWFVTIIVHTVLAFGSLLLALVSEL